METVEVLELEPFYAAYRLHGHGRGALEPSMMVSLLVYAYSVGVRSARQIERRCREDVAVRVITANHHREPDARSRDDREVPGPS